MLSPARILVPSLIVALLAGPLASIALADSGCGLPGRPSCTIIRPLSPGTVGRAVPLGARDCVMYLGGLGSDPSRTKGAFAHIVEGLSADADVIQFDYDALGRIALAADRLKGDARDAATRCAWLHIVTHSMGGVVADRAFSSGLSGADGVRTYIPLASPHNGATAARELCGLADIDASYGKLLRHIAELLDQPDPTAPAICELARVKAPRPPRGVSAARLRLVTDELVLQRDHVARHRDVREFLPEDPLQMEGHGGILRHGWARSIVHRSVREGEVPPDDRSELYRVVARTVSGSADVALAMTFDAVGDALFTGAIAAKLASLTREVLEEIRAHVVMSDPTFLRDE